MQKYGRSPVPAGAEVPWNARLIRDRLDPDSCWELSPCPPPRMSDRSDLTSKLRRDLHERAHGPLADDQSVSPLQHCTTDCVRPSHQVVSRDAVVEEPEPTPTGEKRKSRFSPISSAQKAEIRALHVEGMPLAQIVKTTGFAYDTVQRWSLRADQSET